MKVPPNSIIIIVRGCLYCEIGKSLLICRVDIGVAVKCILYKTMSVLNVFRYQSNEPQL